MSTVIKGYLVPQLMKIVDQKEVFIFKDSYLPQRRYLQYPLAFLLATGLHYIEHHPHSWSISCSLNKTPLDSI